MLYQLQDKINAEFISLLDKDPAEIRKFFQTFSDLDELSVKVIIWGHHFMPKYFNKPTPDFHHELVKIFFRKGNDYTACPRGFAKALALDTPILTNRGFKNLIDVRVGDFVFSELGKQVKVLYKSEVYEDRDCYEVIFSDGSKIVADAGHDWLVEDNLLRHRKDYIPRNGKKETIIARKGLGLIKKTTFELSNDLFIKRKDGKTELKYSIPTTKPVEFLENVLNLDPYFFGQWLGDGNSDRSAITTEDEETIKYLYCYAESLGLKVSVNKTNNNSNTYYLSSKTTKGKNIINTELRRLKVLKNKHIPFEYKFSSVKNRLELLRGLMDSDGTISKNGHCSFTVTNKKLAYDVLELIWSFGIKATIRCEDAKIGKRIIGKYYEICFTTDVDVFNLTRKKERNFKNRDPRVFRRYIVDIKKVNSVPVQCLMVDNPNHLFLAGKELIPTHNTTINQLCVSYSCANGLDEFIVLIEKTWNEAAEVLEAVRDEFKLNDEILRVYGDLTKVNAKGKDQEGLRDSAGDFYVNGVRLRAKGFDTPIRGLKSRHSRPTRVILDDIESDEHIDNVEQREKYLNNYIRGVIPAVDNDTGVIKMWGTILHDDSLLNTLIKNHNGKIYAAWDEDHNLLWPSNWTVDKLEQKRDEMRISEKGDAGFYQEYFNQPLDEENQIFKRTMFQYFKNLDLEELRKKPNRIYTLVDPAISKRTTADFTVVVTVMVDSLNRIFILEITRMRMNPMETIKAIFAHYERWNPIYVGIESVSYQKALKFFVDEEKMKQTSSVRTMNVVEIKPTTDKITKIKKLQPKYAILNVFHNSDDPNTTILEEELLRFPKAVHDDIIDAISYVIEIIIPIQQTVQRKYKAHLKKRTSSVMY